MKALTRTMNELELELIQTHMTQKPMLRVEVGARALRVLIKKMPSVVKGVFQQRICRSLGLSAHLGWGP